MLDFPKFLKCHFLNFVYVAYESIYVFLNMSIIYVSNSKKYHNKMVHLLCCYCNTHLKKNTPSLSKYIYEPVITDEVLRETYTFSNWNTSSDGTGETYDTPCTYKKNSALTLYAQWYAKVNLSYNGNGQSEGEDYTIYNYDAADTATLLENIFSRTDTDAEGKELKYSFQGYSLYTDTLVETEPEKVMEENASFTAAELLQLAKKAGAVTYGAPAYADKNWSDKTKPSDASAVYINLYVVWDQFPQLVAKDRYVALQDAQAGLITEEVLLETVIGTDLEDGTLVNWDAVVTTNYSESDFTSLAHAAEVSITYRATDSVNNQTEETVTVYVVDTKAQKPETTKYTRFISSKYVEADADEGGFAENSIWRTDASYHAAIVKTLSNERTNVETKSMDFFGQTLTREVEGSGDYTGTVLAGYTFTHEQVLEAQQYIETNGFGNTKSPDALSGFLTQFSECAN